jgi:xanthine/uracil permease
VRIWQANRVDFADPVVLMVVAAAVVAGVGNLTLEFGALRLEGIAWGSLAVVVLYPLLRTLSAWRSRG